MEAVARWSIHKPDKIQVLKPQRKPQRWYFEHVIIHASGEKVRTAVRSKRKMTLEEMMESVKEAVSEEIAEAELITDAYFNIYSAR